MDGALQFDPIDHGFGAWELVATLDPIILQGFGDVVSGWKTEAGFLGGEVGPDFEVSGFWVG